MLINLFSHTYVHKFGDFSFKNESKDANFYHLIKRSIMCIFNKAEFRYWNSLEISGPKMLLPHSKMIQKNNGFERANGDFQCDKLENVWKFCQNIFLYIW